MGARQPRCGLRLRAYCARIESLNHQRAGGYDFDAGLVPHDVENAPLAIKVLAHGGVGAVTNDEIGAYIR